MNNRVLVLGGDGMLGHKVFQIFNNVFETEASFLSLENYISSFPIYEGVPVSRIHIGVDALESKSVEQCIRETEPDLVINCIGLIKQLRGSSNHILAVRLNALFPHRLAEICDSINAKMIHFSTDCVFSGKNGNYKEDDIPDPVDTYGKSKLLGEVDYSQHLTFRTSIIGREWMRSTSLLEWFLSQKGGEVKGYKNAIYTGFTTEAISKLILKTVIEKPDTKGLWHISSNPISKCDLLNKIKEALDLNIEIQAYNNPVCDRSLDSTAFFEKTGFKKPSWNGMIRDLVDDPTPYERWRQRNHSLAN
ncbi:sugar nucleotide-binding protein [Candidatus Poribacteria bacterium]|nr:sugar nucleotide-binding protein [Candidatus Poribacteria bacterium]